MSLLSRLAPGIAGRLLLVAALAIALFSAGARSGAAAPKPAESPSSSPAATPSPEPANVAIPRLENAIRANPNDLESMERLAPYYLEAQRPDLASQLTAKLIAGGRKNAQVYYFDGVANEQQNKIKEATASLEQAANYEPTNSQVLLTLTDLYIKQNRGADAERVAKRATTFNKDDKRAFITYGLVLNQLGKFDDARTQLQTAAKIDPKDASIPGLIGRTYAEQKAYPNAIASFNQALAIDPKNVDALEAKAAAYAVSNDPKNAIATYDQLYALAPNDVGKVAVLTAQARVYADAKDQANAEATYKKAITQFPGVSLAHLDYGDYLAALNRMKDAEAEWVNAAGPSNDNRDALMRLGGYYLSSSQYQKAIDRFKRVTEVSPGDPEALVRLGQAYAANRQFDQSRDAYRRSYEIAHSLVALSGLGADDCATRNFSEGTQIFDALQKNVPQYVKQAPQMYLIIGKCYADAGQKAKAKVAYEQLMPLTKPGSPERKQLQKIIDDLDRVSASKPTPKPAPKH